MFRLAAMYVHCYIVLIRHIILNNYTGSSIFVVLSFVLEAFVLVLVFKPFQVLEKVIQAFELSVCTISGWYLCVCPRLAIHN